MSRRNVMLQSYLAYLTPDQMERLRALNEASGAPMTELVRHGVDLILEKRDDEVRAGLAARAGRSS